MSTGSAIPVWYTQDDRQRLEEAAALAGYKHLSTYIRDRSLGRHGQLDAGQSSLQAWANHQQLNSVLAEIERGQRSTQALLIMLLFLAHRKATTGEVNALLLACDNAVLPADLMAQSLPKLADLLARFTAEA